MTSHAPRVICIIQDIMLTLIHFSAARQMWRQIDGWVDEYVMMMMIQRSCRRVNVISEPDLHGNLFEPTAMNMQ